MLSLTTTTLTMSSREIAELCEKEHKHVIRDIRVMLEALGDGPDLDHVQETKDSRGYVAEISLPKELTLTLVTGYNVKLRKRIINRWMQLEEQVAKPAALNPTNLSRLQLIEIAMQAEQERLELENKVSELAPKALALDRIATFSDGSYCLRDAAKIFGIQEKSFRQLLNTKGWIYQRPMGTGWLAHAEPLRKGWMEHKITEGERPDGSQWISHQARITAKGMAKLAMLLGIHLPANEYLAEGAA